MFLTTFFTSTTYSRWHFFKFSISGHSPRNMRSQNIFEPFECTDDHPDILIILVPPWVSSLLSNVLSTSLFFLLLTRGRRCVFTGVFLVVLVVSLTSVICLTCISIFYLLDYLLLLCLNCSVYDFST